MLNFHILELRFPCRDVAGDVINVDKYAKMVTDNFQNIKNGLHFPCKLNQISVVNVANTQCNILFGHSAPQAVKTRKYKSG